jgi:hypothetical protein
MSNLASVNDIPSPTNFGIFSSLNSLNGVGGLGGTALEVCLDFGNI